MEDGPFSFDLGSDGFVPSRYDNRIERRLSNMAAHYLDQEACRTMLEQEDVLLYEVYEVRRPEKAGELLHGISIIYPGKVGDEYFMTKGHFHEVRDTAELYYTLKGEGRMVLETPEGEWAVRELAAGSVLYVPPRWAHRSVNIDAEDDLVMFFAYPGNAGHDYASIESRGFRKLILEVNGEAAVVDNPRWSPPAGKK